ncbi:MAG: exodeoxyribonuclease III [bacterium]|nr:MAG: exodeoxyribonuclease III [bacterium]KAF0147195.1 MAG: exodeoxyribonuclease III [bacterium]KAF0167385.1 MAG: exodeoxyribonuclease III [bacterium]TXT18651.1 MAG: exodeoxyribonuclease III [bacterium]
MRVISLNLNGIRSAAAKGLYPWLAAQHADLICLQELKAQPADLTAEMRDPPGLAGFFHCAEKKGYSGVGLYTRHAPQSIVEGLGIEDIDREGRYLELRFEDFAAISIYLPSGSSSPERQAAKFSFMERFLPHLDNLVAGGRELLLCGDWNIAHTEKDLKNWKSNQKNSGFLPEERAWLTRVFEHLGLVDVYRRLYPDHTGEAYTWWSNRGQARAKNVGWRIDYQIATPGLAAKAQRAFVYKEQRFSDHAPLVVDYDHALD